MWADSQTGLLLKAVVLDKQGIVIEQYAFSQLSIGGKIDRKWIVPNESEAVRLAQQNNLAPLPKANLATLPSGWQVDAVPSGFKKIVEMRRIMCDKKLPVVHIVYSDGLAGISIFIENISEVTELHTGLSSQGAVHIYGRQVDNHLVTVVGEVPPRSVIEVADSVRYAGE
jgi:sigma-E factor negative regulatory protein RseB